MNGSFSPEQLEQLELIVERGVRKGFADAGLRIDDGDQIDEARRDLSFIRNLRKGVNGTASKIGWTVITAILGLLIWLVTQGANFWRVGGGP
jgi:hypothetical protein